MKVKATKDPGGRDAVRITGGDDEVLVACLGAQVLSWRHRGENVLWTASKAEYQPGKPVRGGVPIVFPWFGFHATDAAMPQHGFARNLTWQVADTGGDGAVLTATDDPSTRIMWPHAFALRFRIALADALRLELTIENRGDAPCRCEEALHTYFAVGDVHTASVHGLENVPCTEHAAAPEEAWDHGAPLHFRAETDRVFQAAPERLELQAPALGRAVALRAAAARSAIVWNPWPAKTARLSQMAPDDWQRFVCVETANCKENAFDVAPGKSHELALELSVRDL
ncbi:MAG: D-hexose-6-phosphate mutarotase [Planctomycetota bacterium]